MQKAPVMKASGLAPIDDEPVHVFGRNLEDRVVSHEVEDKREDEDKPEDDVESIKKRKFEAITGEENEETVFQGEFKLFVWDFSTSNWIEKGRGQLKLNHDLTEKRSRLIMRAGGTFRIILNVAIRHSVFKVISNTKTSIRFTDSQTVWAASGSNAKQLGDFINERLLDVESQAQKIGGVTERGHGEGDVADQTEKGDTASNSSSREDDAASRNNETEEDEEEDHDLRNNKGNEDSDEAEEDSKVQLSEDDTSKDDEACGNQNEQVCEKLEPSKRGGEESVSEINTVAEGQEEQDGGKDETKKLKLSSD